MSKFKISFNAPTTLIFSILCIISLLLNFITSGYTNNLFFSIYRSSLTSFFTYLRLFGHVVGHADFSHLVGNLTLILLLGPLLEEKYGSIGLLKLILLTAIITGICFIIFFPNNALLGASGIVFSFIILSSITASKGAIPLTLILIIIIYIGNEIITMIFVTDNVSNLTHIIGGFVGGMYGYFLNKNKVDNSIT